MHFERKSPRFPHRKMIEMIFPTVEEAKEAETDAKAALTAANEELEGCRAGLADARTKAARAAAVLESAKGRRVRGQLVQLAGLERSERGCEERPSCKEVRELTVGLTEAARQRAEVACHSAGP